MLRAPRLATLLLILGAPLAACVPAGAPHEPHDGLALTSSGEGITADWSSEGEHLVSPPLEGAEAANRLALMLTLADAERSPSGLFEGRGLHADGTAGPWRLLEVVFNEEELAVVRVDLDAPADRVQLRLPFDRAGDVDLLTVAAERLEPELEPEPEPEIATSGRGLAADLANAGILPRSAWGARARRCGRREVGKRRMAIHHSVTSRTRGGAYEPVLRMIQSFHMDGRGYCDVGYHFYVTADGRVWEARSVDVRGGHSGGVNTENIGMVFVGCFHDSGACRGLGGVVPPDRMLDGAARAIAALAAKYRIPIDSDRIKGHGQQPGQATACPGSALRARLDDLRARARAGGAPPPPPPPPASTPVGPPAAACGAIAANEALGRGAAMPSCNGAYNLVHQGDGNVVLYNTASGAPVWFTGTHNRSTSQFVLQGDGNLVLYAPGGRPLWASGTAGRAGVRLAVQDDGNVVLYQGRSPIWATGTVGAGQPAAPPPPPPAPEPEPEPEPAPPASCGRLGPDQALAPGQGVRSCNGRYLFVHQTDGNVVLYRGARALWFTGTHGRATETLAMQGDGNLVLYAPGGRPLWHTHTYRHGGSVLAVQDDGNVVVYAPGNRPVFATNTAGR